MKKYTLLLMLMLVSIANSQQLYVEAGKTISSFDYIDSQGNGLDNLQSTTHNFMAFGFRDQFLAKNLNIIFGASYATYGAIGSDDIVGNFMQWDVNYLELIAGLDFELFSIRKASFYIKGTTSGGFLLQGSQIINNTVIDLKNNIDFDRLLINFSGGIGFSYPISKNSSFNVQFMHGKSLNISSGNEKLRIVNDRLSFGFNVDISNKKTL